MLSKHSCDSGAYTLGAKEKIHRKGEKKVDKTYAKSCNSNDEVYWYFKRSLSTNYVLLMVRKLFEKQHYGRNKLHTS